MTGVCLIQGASKGLGLGFCRALLARSANCVVATCRNPNTAPELQALKDEYPKRLTVLQMDVTDSSQIEKTADVVKTSHGKIDLLINSAGLLHPSGRGETSLKDVNAEDMDLTLRTNTIGPLIVAKHFSPLLMDGHGLIGQQAADSKNQHSGILVNISATIGSITDNNLGGWYCYRVSKAALNMVTKNLSVELSRTRKKIICISLYPGSVDTDISRPYHKSVKNLLTVEHSVNSMLDVINSLSMEETGRFYTYEKKTVNF